MAARRGGGYQAAHAGADDEDFAIDGLGDLALVEKRVTRPLPGSRKVTLRPAPYPSFVRRDARPALPQRNEAGRHRKGTTQGGNPNDEHRWRKRRAGKEGRAMGKREAGCTGLLGRPTVFDVGIGRHKEGIPMTNTNMDRRSFLKGAGVAGAAAVAAGTRWARSPRECSPCPARGSAAC